MSKKYQFNKQDLVKIGHGALIALGGAFLTYAASVIGNIDFGSATPIIVALAGILINVGRKFLAGKE